MLMRLAPDLGLYWTAHRARRLAIRECNRARIQIGHPSRCGNILLENPYPFA